MYKSIILNFQEQLSKSAFVLVNVDEHVDFNRPISHKVVYIGGFGQTNPKPLEPVFPVRNIKLSNFFRNTSKL